MEERDERCKEAMSALATLAEELIPREGEPAFGFTDCDLRWVAHQIARENDRKEPNNYDKVQALIEVFGGERSVARGNCEEWPWEGR